MREQRIRPAGQEGRRCAAGAQAPAVVSGAQRDQRGNAHAEHFEPCGECASRSVVRQTAKKERLRPDPIPRFACRRDRVGRFFHVSKPSWSSSTATFRVPWWNSPRNGARTACCATWKPCCWRSEEHTSELQSLRHLVCRL